MSDVKAMLRSGAFERTDSVAINALLEKLRVKDVKLDFGLKSCEIAAKSLRFEAFLCVSRCF